MRPVSLLPMNAGKRICDEEGRIEDEEGRNEYNCRVPNLDAKATFFQVLLATDAVRGARPGEFPRPILQGVGPFRGWLLEIAKSCIG
jgi:hypothetical protein